MNREKIDQIFDGCYSKDLSVCPNHTIFQRGKATNEILALHQKEIEKLFEEIDSLIIGVEGCKFEERLDGDKGCLVLDMNQNQWQALKSRYIKEEK